VKEKHHENLVCKESEAIAANVLRVYAVRDLEV